MKVASDSKRGRGAIANARRGEQYIVALRCSMDDIPVLVTASRGDAEAFAAAVALHMGRWSAHQDWPVADGADAFHVVSIVQLADYCASKTPDNPAELPPVPGGD